jgi:hypothetical protein
MKEVAAEGINATPYVEIEWENGTKKKALFDTGAQWTLIAEDLLTDNEKEEMEESSLSGHGVTGSKIPVIGEIWRTVKLGNTVFNKQRFIVVEHMICPIILGIDFWSRISQLSFNFVNNTLKIDDSGESIPLWQHPFDHQVQSTTMDQMNEMKVYAKDRISIPANSEAYVECICTDLEAGHDYMVQPIRYGDELISTPFGVIKGNSRGVFKLKVANLNNHTITLEKSRCLATLEKDVWVKHNDTGQIFKSNNGSGHSDVPWEKMCSQNLEANKKEQLIHLLSKHRKLFHTGGKLPIVQVGVEHTINLKENVAPTVCRPRRLSQELASEVKVHIDKLLKEGVIRESNSEWASPIVCARKADGSLRLVIDYRLTNDKSKTATLHPIPLIDDLIDHLSKAKYFSTLDAKSGYHQMPLKSDDSAATAFVVPWGHYEFADRCPFGLKGAGYSFQRMMSAILGNSNFVEALCYLDDILVWGETWEIHIQRLKRVLIKIEKSGLALSANKCEFGSTHVNYLGYRIGEGMIRISEQRVEQLRRIAKPKSVRELRSALGAFSYVQRWLPGLSELAKPLYEATAGKAYSRLKWSQDMSIAFEEIKKQIADATALAIPDMDKEFVLVTDCSNIAAGALLAQEAANGSQQLNPCAYFHHALSACETSYSATEKELLAIVLAVKKYRVYLGKKFKLITDHQALKWLKSLDPENETGRRGRWLDLLQQFDMEVIPKRGRSPEMRIADFLSRVTLTGLCTQERSVGKVMVVQDRQDCDEDQKINLDELITHQNNDEIIKAVKQALSTRDALNPGGSGSENWRLPSISADVQFQKLWALKERLIVDETGLLRLRFNGGRRTRANPFGVKEMVRVVVPESYKTKILHLVHISTTAAHMGMIRTWSRARNNFWWPGMRQDVEDFVGHCEQCSKNKHLNRPNEAPQSKTSMPAGPLEELMIDFVGPFQQARTHNFRYALQMQDVFSRFLLFIPAVDCTAKTAAESVKARWLATFGMPSRLRSDRGTHFTAEVFKELCSITGIKQKHGSPEHPQSQGQVERQNQLLSQVRCLCENNVEKWPDALNSVQYSHNAAKNSTTGFSPARIIFGKNLSYPEDVIFNNNKESSNKTVAQRLAQREKDDEELFEMVTTRVTNNQEKRIQGHSTQGEPYKVGDLVRYKLNVDTRSRLGGKMAPKYSEMYEITEVLGDGFTYRLSAVDHAGRDKQRHFDLLKTVDRVELDTGTEAETSDNYQSSNPSQVSNPDSGEGNEPVTADWVRRSSRKRKETRRLQADGRKKTYSSPSHSDSANDSD